MTYLGKTFDPTEFWNFGMLLSSQKDNSILGQNFKSLSAPISGKIIVITLEGSFCRNSMQRVEGK